MSSKYDENVISSEVNKLFNTIIKVLNQYVTANPHKILKNENQRSDDIKKIAKAIFDFAKVNVDFDQLLTKNGMEKGGVSLFPQVNIASSKVDIYEAQTLATLFAVIKNIEHTLKEKRHESSYTRSVSFLNKKIMPILLDSKDLLERIKVKQHSKATEKVNRIESPIYKLPSEVMEYMFSFTDAKDKVRLGNTSRLFRSVAESELLWIDEIRKTFPEKMSKLAIIKKPEESYKDLFKRLMKDANHRSFLCLQAHESVIDPVTYLNFHELKSSFNISRGIHHSLKAAEESLLFATMKENYMTYIMEFNLTKEQLQELITAKKYQVIAENIMAIHVDTATKHHYRGNGSEEGSWPVRYIDEQFVAISRSPGLKSMTP